MTRATTEQLANEIKACWKGIPRKVQRASSELQISEISEILEIF
jgi:hypothetical protein